jgi:hypothetical protein
MAISFPNASRSYDPDGQRVRFWGHDSAREVQFFLEEGALFKLDPKTRNNEAGMLATFDAWLDRIHAVARAMYTGARKTFYTLAAADF